MASQKFGFVTIDPVSGSGSTAVNVSGDKYTGRVQRTKTFNVNAPGVTPNKTLVVNQAAATEFVSVNSATASVNKEGGSVTITGKSNSTKLTFSVKPDGTHPLTLTIPGTYTAAGKSTSNGAAIADDPGASGEYEWSITFTDIPENTSLDELISTLTITAAGAQTATVTVTQAAGDPYLELDKTVINLDVNGTAQTVNVDTNTTFTFVEAATNNLRQALNGK